MYNFDYKEFISQFNKTATLDTLKCTYFKIRQGNLQACVVLHDVHKHKTAS